MVMKKLPTTLTALSILLIATVSYAQTYTVERVVDGDIIVVTVDGVRVEGFKAKLNKEGGVLILYTGDDPNFDHVEEIIFWFIPKDPDGLTIESPGKNSGNMSYDKKNPDVNISMDWLKKFKYKLVFGQEKDFKIPVYIDAEGGDPHKVHVRGNIIAATAGIKMKEGVFDRSYDHLDSIKWMTKDWIMKNKEVMSMGSLDVCFMEISPKKKPKESRRQVAACSFLYINQNDKVEIVKLWLEKIDGQWKEVKMIEASELFMTHPIKPLFRDEVPYTLGAIAGKRFEEEIYNPLGGFVRVKEPMSSGCGGSERNEVNHCEIQYKVYNQDRPHDSDPEGTCEAVTYIFSKDKEGNWVITNTLGTDQKYDWFKKTIEKRKEGFQLFCG